MDTNSLYDLYSTYMPIDPSYEMGNYDFVNDVDLPWRGKSSSLLEWWITVEYNDQTYEQMVPVSVLDFTEKFLKHPEYGEILRFDIDKDAEDDIEIIAGFYWSVVRDVDGDDVASLEKRLRFRQLETGNYIENAEESITVWSEIHINYGLFRKSATNTLVDNPWLLGSFWTSHLLQNVISILGENHPLLKFDKFFSDMYIDSLLSDRDSRTTPVDENDYISVGTGYRSEQGEDIPRYFEKRFSFGRDELFSPSIFQHSADPGSEKGQASFESLYGFKSYKSGSSTPSYDIEFSIRIDPSVYMKTKFVPRNGHIFYYFDEYSQTNNQIGVTFNANIEKGSGEDVSLSLLFDAIDDSLGRSGRWMSFDIDLVGDNDPLGGNIYYAASHRFTVDMIVNSPLFEEKISLRDIPDRVDVSWDLDFVLIPTPSLYAHVDGFIDVSMSSQIGELSVFYPKTDPSYEDKIFISVPQGIPMDSRFEAEATLQLDVADMQNHDNYISGRINHECSSNIDDIQVFLPDEETPLLRVTDIPSFSEVKSKLRWAKLQGYAYMWRGSQGPPDPIEINLEYKGFNIHDIITIRNGYINTKFKMDHDGYFFFDTSEGIIGNSLAVGNSETGDSLSLDVEEVSADELQANWNIDTSGDRLKIMDIGFNGMIDTVKGLQLGLDYQGKKTSLNLDWVLGETGAFQIVVDQEDDLSIDFSQFALNSSVFDFDGGIMLSDVVAIDMDWQLKQGESTGSGNVNPGHFSINKYNDQSLIKEFDFYLTYQDKYGVDISFDNLRFYLDFEWWKGDRLLPYIWLDYEISSDEFDVDLLWTNLNGETQWYEHVEDW